MNLEDVLNKVATGEMKVEEAKKSLATYEDLGYAKVDLHRKKRQGFPEVIYGEGKSIEHIVSILKVIHDGENNILVTRVSQDKAEQILQSYPELTYHDRARILSWKPEKDVHDKENDEYIAIISAGTSDLDVAEEVAVTAEVLGSKVRRFYDVGVAGIHRLLDQTEDIQRATVSVVIAGMEGALPSVVGGLVSHPVIAVPTSVGYGANFKGVSALLTMLNSCSSGISVVNIDNGFGGAYNAALIDQLARKGRQKHDS